MENRARVLGPTGAEMGTQARRLPFPRSAVPRPQIGRLEQESEPAVGRTEGSEGTWMAREKRAPEDRYGWDMTDCREGDTGCHSLGLSRGAALEDPHPWQGDGAYYADKRNHEHGPGKTDRPPIAGISQASTLSGREDAFLRFLPPPGGARDGFLCCTALLAGPWPCLFPHGREGARKDRESRAIGRKVRQGRPNINCAGDMPVASLGAFLHTKRAQRGSWPSASALRQRDFTVFTAFSAFPLDWG